MRRLLSRRIKRLKAFILILLLGVDVFFTSNSTHRQKEHDMLPVMTDHIPHPDAPDLNIVGKYLKISWTLYTIAGIVIILQLYAQGRVLRNLGWGDALVVLSWVLGILSCIFLTIASQYGFGRHFYYLNASDRIDAMRLIYINEPLSIMCAATGRLSFLVLIHRIFGTNKYRRWFIIFMMAQTVIINLVTAITVLAQCPNVNTLWDPSGFPGNCWNPLVQQYIGFFQSSCNSATDLVLAIMPVYLFWSLQIDLKTKLGLICLMSLSIFAFVASVIKTYLLGCLTARSDYTWNIVPCCIWISIENNLVMIAASVPLIRSIFTRPHSKSPTHKPSDHGTNGHGYVLSSIPPIRDVSSVSEEKILPFQIVGGRRGIVNSVDYTVMDEDEAWKEAMHEEWVVNRV